MRRGSRAAWIPFTYLPREAVTAAWTGLMFAAAFASCVPLLRRGPTGWAAFALFGPFQFEGAMYGNVQPLLVLMLMWGVERRAGPLWIALGREPEGRAAPARRGVRRPGGVAPRGAGGRAHRCCSSRPPSSST